MISWPLLTASIPITLVQATVPSPWTIMAAFELSAPALGPLQPTLHTRAKRMLLKEVKSELTTPLLRTVLLRCPTHSGEKPKVVSLTTADKALTGQAYHFLPLSLITYWLPCWLPLCPTCFSPSLCSCLYPCSGLLVLQVSTHSTWRPDVLDLGQSES